MQQPSLSSSHHTVRFDWRIRARAALIHLALSALFAALVGALVFALWYPYPYRGISGGSNLFRLVVAVDVVLGPLITFAIFNLAKTRRELRRDLAVVALLQLAGLGYGLYTVHLARPLHTVFEYDRFRVVHQNDIPPELASRAPAGITLAPWGQPTWLSLRPFRSDAEKVEFTMAALGGVQLSARPELWQPYEAGRDRILQAARPISDLKSRFPERTSEIDKALAGTDAARAAYLPLIARKETAWTVLLDSQTTKVIGFIPIDSF